MGIAHDFNLGIMEDRYRRILNSDCGQSVSFMFRRDSVLKNKVEKNREDT